MHALKNKAVFVDKDGTLIRDIPFNVDPALIELDHDVIQGLKSIQADGYLVIIISNQSGVARGYFPESDLAGVQNKIRQLFEENRLVLHGFYWCPHFPTGVITDYVLDCTCRKPKPGMIFQAADDLDIDLARSWMIGDILHDVEAGHRAGCRSILIDNGNETVWELTEDRTPDFTAENFEQAASYIVHQTIVPPCIIT